MMLAVSVRACMLGGCQGPVKPAWRCQGPAVHPRSHTLALPFFPHGFYWWHKGLRVVETCRQQTPSTLNMKEKTCMATWT